MVDSRILPINLWLLEHSSDVVRRLERVSAGLVVLRDSERLGIEDVRFSVPEGIAVYDVVLAYRLKGQLLATAREGDDYGRAYLSLVRKPDGGLNVARYAEELLRYSWFNHKDSSFVFDRLLKRKTNTPLYALSPQGTRHPFLD